MLEEIAFFLIISALFPLHLLFANGISRELDTFEPLEGLPKYILFTFGRERIIAVIFCFMAVLSFFLYLASKISQLDNWYYYDYLGASFQIVLALFSLFTLASTISITTKEKQKNISFRPFSTLFKIANILPKKYRETLEQEISDMLLEYYEALSEKKFWRAKIIAAFYYIGLSWSVIIWIADKVKKVIGIIPKMD